MNCDVGEATEGLENELWRRWSKGRVGEWAVMWVKQGKGWRMSCDVGELTESLENQNELWRRWSDWKLRHSSFWFSKLSVTSPTSQLILQPFPCFTYVTTHSPTLLVLHIHLSSFSNPSFASSTSQDFHLRHLASRPYSKCEKVCVVCPYLLFIISLFICFIQSAMAWWHYSCGCHCSPAIDQRMLTGIH